MKGNTMKTKKSSEELFQIFFDGTDFCAEDFLGIWHVAVQDSDGNFHVEEHTKKPARFSDSELLTFKEIRKRKLYILCVNIYCAHQFLEGATSMSEAADRLKAEVKNVKSLEKKGWEFIEPIEKGHARFTIPLEPYDSSN